MCPTRPKCASHGPILPQINIKMPKSTPTPAEKRTGPYWPLLNQVIDPELFIGIVDLGLVYKITVKKKSEIHVIMTLTSPACPVGPHIIREVEDKLRRQKGIEKVYVEITWDPYWTQNMINPDIRDLMF